MASIAIYARNTALNDFDPPLGAIIAVSAAAEYEFRGSEIDKVNLNLEALSQ